MSIVTNLKKVQIYLKTILLTTIMKKKKSKDPIQRTVAKLFLNTLYGRLGMKDIDNTMKIVDKKEAETLDKNKNVTVFS